MLKRIVDFFDTRLALPEAEPERTLQLAACALLFEMVKADFSISDNEMAAMRCAMKNVVGIDDATSDELLLLAQQEAEAATSLYPFTRLINDNYSDDDKQLLVKALWKIAFADGHVDKYEEHYLRKLSDLLYIPHSMFIQTKLAAQQEIDAV